MGRGVILLGYLKLYHVTGVSESKSRHKNFYKKGCIFFFIWEQILCKGLLWFYFFFQDDMNLTEDKKAPLRNRDMNMKRAMLSMHISAGKVWTWVLNTWKGPCCPCISLLARYEQVLNTWNGNVIHVYQCWEGMNTFLTHEKGHIVHANQCWQGMNKFWSHEKGHVVHAYQCSQVMNKFWTHEKGLVVHVYQCWQGMNKFWTHEKGNVVHVYQWRQGVNILNTRNG